MITGDIKNKIDGIWDTFFSAGISSPLTVLEQMTYLFFIKMLDDAQLKKEFNAKHFGAEIKDPIFKSGNWQNPDTKLETPYNQLRWSTFKNLDASTMLSLVRNEVFVFIKNINTGKDSSYSRFMKDALFMIPNERTLTRVVDGINGLDLNDKDSRAMSMSTFLGKWLPAEPTVSSARLVTSFE